MKKLILLLSFLPFFVNGQNDTTFSSNTEVISVNEKGIDALVKYKGNKLYVWAVYSYGIITRDDEARYPLYML